MTYSPGSRKRGIRRGLAVLADRRRVIGELDVAGAAELAHRHARDAADLKPRRQHLHHAGAPACPCRSRRRATARRRLFMAIVGNPERQRNRRRRRRR